jgi:hypothetical protein
VLDDCGSVGSAIHLEEAAKALSGEELDGAHAVRTLLAIASFGELGEDDGKKEVEE